MSAYIYTLRTDSVLALDGCLTPIRVHAMKFAFKPSWAGCFKPITEARQTAQRNHGTRAYDKARDEVLESYDQDSVWVAIGGFEEGAWVYDNVSSGVESDQDISGRFRGVLRKQGNRWHIESKSGHTDQLENDVKNLKAAAHAYGQVNSQYADAKTWDKINQDLADAEQRLVDSRNGN